MADRVEIRTVSCPASTPQVDAIEVDLSFASGRVDDIEVHIPRGHRGNTGIAFCQAHQVVIPASGGDWIIGDGDVLHFGAGNQVENGNWQARLYNADRRAHQWQIRFHVSEHVAAPRLAFPGRINPRDIYTARGTVA